MTSAPPQRSRPGPAPPVVAAAVVLAAALLAWFALSAEDAPPPGPTDAAAEAVESDDASRARRRPTEPEAAPPPEPPDANRRPATFLGRVVGPDGAPVAGATVTATSLRDDVPAWLAPPGADEPSATSAADASGTFRVVLSVPAAAPAPAPPRAAAVLVASAPGFTVAAADHALEGVPVTIRLAAEGVLEGRVLDLAGRPVAGARVACLRCLAQRHVDVVATTTGADGGYRIGGFDVTRRFDSPMRPVLFDVRAAGFAAHVDAGPFPAAGRTLRRDVVLLPARPLEVLVVVDDGSADGDAPVEGATVVLDAVGGAEDGWDRVGRAAARALPPPAPHLGRATTDARGLCRVDGAPAHTGVVDSFEVRAGKAGFTEETVHVTSRQATEDERVVVRIWPSATVRGRVVDATGAPVPDVPVVAEIGRGGRAWPAAPGAPLPGRDVTDREGRYVLTGVHATSGGTGRVIVSTWGPGLMADGRVLVADPQATVELHPRLGDDTVAPDIVLPAPVATRTARLTVVDVGGAPVADASIRPNSCDRAPTTDDAGRVVLHWPLVPARSGDRGAEVVVEVAAPGFARTVVRCRPDAESPPEVRVVLGPPSRLVGSVHEEDGTPFAGAWIAARRADCEGDWLYAWTAPDGAFAIDDLPAVPFLVDVSTAGPDDARAGARGLRVPSALPGGASVHVTLPPPDPHRGTLVATVVDADDGTPLLEAWGTLACGPQPLGAYATSDSPGVLTLAHVPAGTWSLDVTAFERVPETIDVTVAEGATTRVRVAMRRGTAVAVRLVLPEDVRDETHDVTAVRVDGAPGEARAGFTADARKDAQGRLRFGALVPGRYRLRCQVGYDSPRVVVVSDAEFVVGPPSARTAEVTVRVVPAGTLAIAIEDVAVPLPVPRRRSMSGGGASRPAEPEPSPLPPPGETWRPAAVEVVAADGVRHFVAVPVTRDGLYASLLPGGYVIRLHLPSGGTREAGATVRAGATAVVTFAKDGTTTTR